MCGWGFGGVYSISLKFDLGGAKNPRDFSGKIETFHSCSCCYHFCLVHFINYCMRTMFVVSSAHLLKVSLKVSSILN